MDNSALLLSIAQIAIAFAGFASLATMLGRERSRDGSRFDAWRLRIILETALAVVLFALLPFIPDAFGLNQSATWRICSGAFLFWNLTGVVLSWRRASTLQRQGLGSDSRGYVVLFLVLEVLNDVPLFVVALGVFAEAASALYLLALVVALVQAGLFFIRLISSLLEVPAG